MAVVMQMICIMEAVGYVLEKLALCWLLFFQDPLVALLRDFLFPS